MPNFFDAVGFFVWLGLAATIASLVLAGILFAFVWAFTGLLDKLEERSFLQWKKRL